MIEIDIPGRSIQAGISEQEMESRRAEELARGELAFTPRNRDRIVSKALQTYAKMVSSRDTGAIRIL
jgi:dihydroxy-acid dehydratase